MVWLIIVVIIIALLALVMLSPVIISINSTRSEGRIEGSFSINWLILLVRYALIDRQTEIFIFNRRIVSRSYIEKAPAPESIEKPRRRKRPKKSRLNIRHAFNLAGPLLRFLRDLVTAFRLKQLYIDLKYGLNDPAYTGILAGLLYASRGLYQIEQNIIFSPDFTGQVLDWNLRVEVSIIPARIVPPISRFITNRQVLRAAWETVRG